MSEKPMTLDEFVAEMLSDVQAFKEFWENNQPGNREEFPDAMEHGEWDEQFRAWSE